MNTCRIAFSICAPDTTKCDGSRLNFRTFLISSTVHRLSSRFIFETYCQMRLAFLPLALHTSIVFNVLKCSVLSHSRVFIHYRQAFRLMLIDSCKLSERLGWTGGGWYSNANKGTCCRILIDVEHVRSFGGTKHYVEMNYCL